MGLTLQLYEQYQAEFIERCQKVENGEISPLELATKFYEEMQYLNELIDTYKAWLNENVDSITDESEQYGSEGYNGYIFKKQTRETLSFKHLTEWQKLEEAKKKFEERSKTALRMVRNGGLNVDEKGEVIPLPQVSVSSFIKTEKVRR